MIDKERQAVDICYQNLQKYLETLKQYIDSNGSEKPLGIKEENGIYQDTVDALYTNIMEWLELLIDMIILF